MIASNTYLARVLKSIWWI